MKKNTINVKCLVYIVFEATIISVFAIIYRFYGPDKGFELDLCLNLRSTCGIGGVIL